MQTSKIILFLSYSCAIILSLVTIIAAFIDKPFSELTVLASAAWAEVSIHTAVYSIKAKSENRLKILLSMIKELSQNDKFEPEIIVQLFEGVTRGE